MKIAKSLLTYNEAYDKVKSVEEYERTHPSGISEINEAFCQYDKFWAISISPAGDKGIYVTYFPLRLVDEYTDRDSYVDSKLDKSFTGSLPNWDFFDRKASKWVYGLYAFREYLNTPSHIMRYSHIW